MGGLEKNFQTQSISERVSLLRTKSRDKEGAASIAGRPPNRPGRARLLEQQAGSRESEPIFIASRQRKFLLEGCLQVIG